MVEIAGNGIEAVLRVMDAGRPVPDVVLMDIHMPEMDGYEATRVIRRDKRYHVQPIIVLTNVMAGDMARCLGAGMNDHLDKPVDTGGRSLPLWSGGRLKAPDEPSLKVPQRHGSAFSIIFFSCLNAHLGMYIRPKKSA